MPTMIATLDPVTNRETWVDAVQFVDQETGETIDLIDPDTEEVLVDAVTISVREQNKGAIVLTGTLDNGAVAVLADGVVQWEFSAEQMAALCNRSYDIGAILEKDGQTVQFLLGSLPVLHGVISP